MANLLIPRQFFFRFELACPRFSETPKGGRPAALSQEHRLPFPGVLDGITPFADVFVGWNPQGLAIAWEVRGKKLRVHGELDKPNSCDGLAIWLNTRGTQNIHRGNRFCQRFLFLAHNGQPDGAAIAQREDIPRAMEQAPPVPAPMIRDSVRIDRFALGVDGTARPDVPVGATTSYRCEVWLPASVLHGFDPLSASRLGFCYRLRDFEKGDQLLAAGPDFPYWEDPSLWPALALTHSDDSATPARSRPARKAKNLR